MKKNWISRRGVPIHVLKKVFLMMKLTFLLTVVLQVSTWATGCVCRCVYACACRFRYGRHVESRQDETCAHKEVKDAEQ